MTADQHWLQREKAGRVLAQFPSSLCGQDRPLGDIADHAYKLQPTPDDPHADTVQGSFRMDTLWLVAELLAARETIREFRWHCAACNEEFDFDEVDCAENVDHVRLCGDCFGRWHDAPSLRKSLEKCTTP